MFISIYQFFLLQAHESARRFLLAQRHVLRYLEDSQKNTKGSGGAAESVPLSVVLPVCVGQRTSYRVGGRGVGAAAARLRHYQTKLGQHFLLVRRYTGNTSNSGTMEMRSRYPLNTLSEELEESTQVESAGYESEGGATSRPNKGNEEMPAIFSKVYDI
ncbi:hypothetical protein E2C01_031950 [Portunus trituberculatus]|uniref:Uncharacterized protein n=1 Tax=Portunus trituberculatus TaxID=210409 RepID=A0A5B7EW52_PORTR|nr:hypothetical protein [Portunus trituberculatus]